MSARPDREPAAQPVPPAAPERAAVPEAYPVGAAGRCVVCGSTRPAVREVPLAHGAIHRCPACGSGLMLPRPDRARLVALHSTEDYFEHPYFEQRRSLSPALRAAYDRRIALIGAVLGPLGGRRLLDVGCDTGSFLAYATEAARLVGVGIDVSARVVAQGRAGGLDLRQGTLEQQDFPADSFDAVCAFDLIEHVDDPDRFLAEVLRILKPGGVLALETANFDGLVYRIGRLIGRLGPLNGALKPLQERLWPPFHVQYYTPAALAAALTRTGFREVETSGREFAEEELAVSSPPVRLALKGIFLAARISGQNTLLGAVAQKPLPAAPAEEDPKAAVRRFWEGHPLMTGELAEDPDSRAFFEAHERIYQEDVFPGTGFPDSFFPFAPGAAVLDVGCGPGLWVRQLARRGCVATGLDLTETAVRIARRSLELFGLAATVRQGDAENLPFADGSFDGVVSHGVIHHTPDTARCVAEIARVLKPGGRAVVSVYYRNVVLRSPFLTRLVSWLLGRLVTLPGRGRGRLLRSGDPDEIVRLYDGSGNPIGKAFTGPAFEAMFRDAGLKVTGRARFYFPLRGFGPLKALLKPLHRWLSEHQGLMYVVFAEKQP